MPPDADATTPVGGAVGALAPLGGVVAALALLAGAASTWVSQPVVRSIGDVVVDEFRATAGYEIVPLAVVVALAGLVCSVALFVTRGGARRVVALALAVVGVAAVAAVAAGLLRVGSTDGLQTAAPALSASGASGMLAAGLRAFGRPGRRMPRRFEVDAPPTDDEWVMASVGDDGGGATGEPSPPGASDPTDEGDERP